MISHPAAKPSARLSRLLMSSALCGAAMLPQPSLAGTLPGIPSAANITVSSGGSQPLITFPDAITLQIELNAPRTVINWTDLHLSSGDAMNFIFDAASDIVLNKTTSQITVDSGAIVTGTVGAATAGNVWFYSPQGVIISPGATMTAGGFLFSRGSSLNDLSFVGSADPLANLRAATDALIRITTISSATTASINSSGDVVLSASSGALNVSIVEGNTAEVSTTSGSITISEMIATGGAAVVTAGGPGATVTQITGATGVTVFSNNNTSVGSATTTGTGDIHISSNGSASLTLGNSGRDLTLSAPQVFMSTVDAVRDVFVTGTTSAFVTNRIFAGDDIEITADGDVSAGGAYLKSTGVGAVDDAHILLRSTTGAVNASNTLLTQGTGVAAGDITISAATTATAGTLDSSRDVQVTGVTASLANGSAARDLFVTGTTGGATVTTQAIAGDDVEITATSGNVSASGATLRSTGVGATDDAHVLARSTTGSVAVGTAQTQGTGAAAGDVTVTGGPSASLASASSTRDLTLAGSAALTLTGNYSANRTASLTSTTGSITQTSGVIAAQTLTGSAIGGASFGGDNQVAQLGNFTNTGGLLLFNNATALSVTGTVLSTGTLRVQSHGGMTFAATGTVRANGAGDAVILASDGLFTNGRGADAVTTPAGRWLVYTQAAGDPAGSTAGDTFGGLAGKSYYGTAYDFSTGTFGATPGAGNRFVHAYTPILTVTPNGLTVTYDGAVHAGSTATITGLVNGDLAVDAWSGAPVVTGSGRNAGTYTLNANVGSLASALNYAFGFGTGTLQIDPKALTGALTANDRTYNGTTAATGSIALTGVVAGDAVSAAGTYTFADKNAGSGKTVTASGVTLSGTDAGNYTVSVATDTADIQRAALTGLLTANDRTYDGTTAATGTIALNGVVAGDAVNAAGNYAFADKNAGTGKTVTASGVTLSGTDAANYTVSVATDTADIQRAALTGALTANDKTYDGTTATTGTIALTGVVTGDTVGAAGTYTFADKNAGIGKTVTASGVALSGTDAGNYTVSVAIDTADIQRAALTGVLTANDKTYDGTTAATGAIALTGAVAGETVSAAGTYAFADKNAGIGKTVTASGVTLSGTDAGNYTVSVATDTADIQRRLLTVTANGTGKAFSQVDPPLTYLVSSGQLVAGDTFTGGLVRDAGEAPGAYDIQRGTLNLSSNYDMTFVGAIFAIGAVPTNDPGGSAALKYLLEGPDFTLNWDPSPNLTVDAAVCFSDDCPN
ncbi:hypothetical protein ASD76_06215 [Altererythrobacter sp. Root672]|nr:hypothetical protein ASD76_06215 [Altererythrobacter sp. Root672]